MIFAAVVSAFALGLGSPHPVQVQTPTQPPSRTDPSTSTLPDVEVIGRPTREAVREFVGRVAAPSMGRGLARWRAELCPGVANLDPAASQAIVDRITSTAAGLGIRTGEPGCKANLVVIFTDDGTGLTQALVARDRHVFRQNFSGLDRGAAAFRDFQTTERPVRWWSLSVAIDSRTGQRAFRMPGDPTGVKVDPAVASALGCEPDDCGIGAAPMLVRDGASRLNTQIVDDLYKTIIIVDVDLIGQVNTSQLGDYLAFIGLAQIDSEADTTGFDTVLNLFSGGNQDGLTEWDRSYLSAIYAARSERVSSAAQASAVADIMTRDRLADGRRQ
ncbi:hypothetical protein BH09PSE1_BH09PSE1_14830 [soil metagenome]